MEARELLLVRLTGRGSLANVFAMTQNGARYAINKMYTYLMSQFLKVEWKSITLHNTVHPMHKFILRLAVQHRLAIVDRLLTISITVPADCTFCGGEMQTFKHLYFDGY